jgi:protein transport protein SEC13
MTTPATAAPAASNSKGPIYIDTQHDDMIHDAQMDYYGTKLATSSSDRTVKIYDVNGETYTHTATLQGHTGPVWSISWSHPTYGGILSSASFDGSIMIHRESRPREWTLLCHKKSLHESSVNATQFAPHNYGLILANASSDGRVSVLSHQMDDSWSCEYIQDNSLGVNSLSFAPFGAYASEESKESQSMYLVTAGCDNQIRFWSKSDSDSKWTLDSSPIDTSSVQHSDWVRDVAWCPCILPNINIVASCSEDRTVIIWTQKGGMGQEWKPFLLKTFEEPVWRVSWSVTGNILAVSSGDNSVSLWKQTVDEKWVQVQSMEEGKE